MEKITKTYEKCKNMVAHEKCASRPNEFQYGTGIFWQHKQFFLSPPPLQATNFAVWLFKMHDETVCRSPSMY